MDVVDDYAATAASASGDDDYGDFVDGDDA